MGKSKSKLKSGERRSNREALRSAKDRIPGGVQAWAQQLLHQSLSGRFAHISPVPGLMKLELALEIQPVNHLVIRCRATLDYGGVQAVRALDCRISLDKIPDGTAPGPRTERMHDILQHQLPLFFRDLVRTLPDRYPSDIPGDQSFASVFQSVAYDGFVLGRTGASFPGAVKRAAHDCLPDLQVKLMETIRGALEERPGVQCPPGSGLAFPSLREITLSATGTGHGTIALSASLSLLYASPIACCLTVYSRPMAPKLRAVPRTQEDSLLFETIANLAQPLAEMVLGRLPLAEVLPPDAFPEGENPFLPLPLHQTLLQGFLSGGLLEYNPLFPDRKSDCPAFSRIFLGKNRDLELLSATDLGKEPERTLTLDIPAFRRALKRPFALAQRYAMPQSPGELLRFCQEADRLYQAQDWKTLSRPVVRLFFNARHEISHIRFQRKTVSASGWKARKEDHVSLRRRFLALLEQVRTAEEEKQNLEEQQRAVLLSLSPAQMHMIRLLAPRNCSQTRAEAKLREGGFLRPSAALPLLKSLTKILLPFERGTEPLVRTRVRLGDWKNYDVYFVSSRLKDGLLEQIPRRPWTADELDLLTPSAAEAWLYDQAARASTPEERWQVFSLLESRFPEAVSVRFVRSEAGQAFFRQIRGADASYVRLFLETLHGCRTLAARLFPDAPDANTGADPS